MTNVKPTIAIIGGTGNEGAGLALRWANAGYPIIIGSRSAERATIRAKELNRSLHSEQDDAPIRGLENKAAAAASEIVVVTVPYAGHAAILDEIAPFVQAKIVVDATVPLKPPKVAVVTVPPAGSASQEAQAILGPGASVVTAFQNISAENLQDLDRQMDTDVLVCGDDKEAKQRVIELIKDLGMRGLDVGPLANAIVVEGLTSLLIAINRRYKAHGAGIRITGIPETTSDQH
ncbi:MAG TPA: NADPH-dependent F420 reductase [Chloroflexi bacterium]|nr:NADPH-dependent F420 reductase [Chloroflexota bacterium]